MLRRARTLAPHELDLVSYGGRPRAARHPIAVLQHAGPLAAPRVHEAMQQRLERKLAQPAAIRGQSPGVLIESSTSCEFRDAVRPRTHAVTIVRCHRGGRYVQTVDFRASHRSHVSGHCWDDERRAVMLPLSGRVGTIHTSAAEARDLPGRAYRAFPDASKTL